MHWHLIFQSFVFAMAECCWMAALVWLSIHAIRIFFPQSPNRIYWLAAGGVTLIFFSWLYFLWVHLTQPTPVLSLPLSGIITFNTLTISPVIITSLAILYLMGLGIGTIRFFFAWQQVHKLNQQWQALPVEWNNLFQTLQPELRFARTIRAGITSHATTPLTFGWLQPVVLFPVAAINHLSMAEARTIILHEFAHIRRNDYLHESVLGWIEIILFCNPFARELFILLREEREKACDDAVLKRGGEKIAYLSALGWCMRNTHSVKAVLGVAGKDSQMLARMKRIANQPISGIRLSPLLFFAAIVTLFCGLFFTNNSKQAPINRIPFAATQIKLKKQPSNASSIDYAILPQTQVVGLTTKAKALSKIVLPPVSLCLAEQPIPNTSPEIISIPSFNQLNKLAIISVVNTPNNYKGIINTLKQRFQAFTEVERKQLLSHVFTHLSREEKQEILNNLQFLYLLESNTEKERDSIPSDLTGMQADSNLPVISPMLRLKLLSLLWDEVNKIPLSDAIQLLQPIMQDSSRVIIEQPFIPIP
jgi:beta-lactamase regulating signal transducer with metallopeptidase domain